MKLITILLAVLFSTSMLNAQIVNDDPLEGPQNPEFVKYMNGIDQPKNTSNLMLGEIPYPVQLNFDNASPFQATKSLPAVYDLRTEGGGLVTSVKDQKISGPCWAFGNIGAIESNWIKNGYGTFDLSEKNLSGCHGFIPSVCSGGNMMMATAYYTRYNGPVNESEDTYPTSPTCPTGWSCGGSYTPQGYVAEARFLPGKASPSFSIDLVKQTINDNGAVYVNMYYEEASYNSGNYTYYYSGSGSTNHGVLLAGWDDTKVTDGGTGAWIVKNSWGTSWGDAGYFYISYNDTKALTDIAYYPFNTLASGETYQGYDKLGQIGQFGWADNTNYGLVKFTASSDQRLERVGSYTHVAGATLSFKVYSSFDGTNLSGLLGEIPGNLCTYPGVYMFDVTDEILISSGSNYYILCEYNTPGTYYSIPYEGSSSGYASATIETGKCWAANEIGSGWKILGLGNPDNTWWRDLCIKATTTPVTISNSVTFNVTDISSTPIANATVNFNGTNYYTNTSGQVIIYNVINGLYPYNVSKVCMLEENGNVTVNNDSPVVNVQMDFDPVASTIVASISEYTNVTCRGLNNGTATANATGGTTPYTYYWSTSPAQTTQTATSLRPITYYVTVTEAAGCPSTASVTITQPAAALTNVATKTNITCYGLNNGTATSTPSGGTSPYTYLWSNAQTTAQITGLSPGTYSITVSDANSCTTTSSVTITEPALLTSAPSQVEPDISSCNGTATITPTGGTTPYTYIWNTAPAQYTSTATDICGGTCAVTATDANGCTTTQSYTFKKATNLRVVGTPATNSATIAWDGSGATSYQLRFNIVGSTSYIYSTVYSSPYTKQLLEPNTNYQCCIRTYNGGVYSSFSSPITFTTDNGVSYLATNLRVAGTPSTNSATIAWDGSGATYYQLRFNVLGTTVYTYNQISASPYTKQQLLANTTYECRIMTYYGGVYTAYSSPITFTTANETSYLATNLRVVGTPLTNDVTMAWDGSGATNYQLRFNVSGSTAYIYSIVYTSPYTRIFLNPNTNYECCIRTNNGGTYTTFSSPVAFTTANGVSYIATNLRVVGTPAATSAVLTWDGSGADWYQLRFNVLGSTSYTYNKVYTSDPVTKTSLLPGTTYQCCIITCKNGTYSGYSSPISFTTAASKSMISEGISLRDLILYPNPASTTLNIEFESYTDGIYIMEISDITGRVLLNDEGIIEERNYTIQKDVSTFEKGIYLVRVFYGNETKVLRFVKE